VIASTVAVGAVGDGLPQVVQVADGAHGLDRLADDHGDAGGVVAAIFETCQTGEEQVLNGALADISNDAAHGRLLSLGNDAEPRSAAP